MDWVRVRQAAISKERGKGGGTFEPWAILLSW